MTKPGANMRIFKAQSYFQDKREILFDDRLKALFGRKKSTFFKLQKLLVPHIKSVNG